MKYARLLFASLALSLLTACASDVTGPGRTSNEGSTTPPPTNTLPGIGTYGSGG